MSNPPSSVPPDVPQPKRRRGPVKRVLIWGGSIFGAFVVLAIVLAATGVDKPPPSHPAAQALPAVSSTTAAPTSTTKVSATTTTPVSHARTTTTHAPASTPTKAATVHHVIYQFGLDGTLRGNDLEQIGLGWNDPKTGVHELPPETSASRTTPLQFPYVVQFNVTNLQLDNQHIAVGSTVDTPDVTVDCTIIIDGQVVDAETGTYATMNPDGTVDMSGGSDCMIDH